MYYQAVSTHLLRQLWNRALTLVRCAYGLCRCFYQKTVHEEIPAMLHRVEFKRAKILNFAYRPKAVVRSSDS